MQTDMAALFDRLPQQGCVDEILLRPARRQPMLAVAEAEVAPGTGLVGDRFRGRPDSKRQVTLFQQEFLQVLASLLHRDRIDARLLRRNLLVSGINLNALRGRRFAIGDAILEGTVLCHPCSRMEEAFGAGGFNALRGIGGLCARVVTGGAIRRGDTVAALPGHPVVGQSSLPL